MIKKKLAEEITQYTFDPMPGKHFGNNILALTAGDKVLLLDTGYDFQAVELFQDIKAKGLVLDSIIISHFHDDHMQGLKVLPKVPVYGSSHYKITLDLWTEKEEHHIFTPAVQVEDNYTISFGRHNIVLIPFPGHSMCTLLTKIDDKYVHIADELMFSNEGKPLLPSTDPGCIKRHVDSLDRLRDYSPFIFLPGHGPGFDGKEMIEREIKNRQVYFKAILESGTRITYEEAVKKCDCEFLHSEWHESVYE